ncbi:glycosyltransferase family 2 protein [Flavobacterium kingsejongi]|uniref:Glycosyl transferase n=1 Tax=Flavobacterium kingsejongi TaxID=1678728 RepID=A0A2S1LNW1_9FLAO|nr:glycosyltransferase [Flavobacterium kingsejongi]AWG25388.1 glycosyl transferase [Flavobacterium kingsejongi]
MTDIKFSLLLTTKNRKEDLLFTLHKIGHLLDRPDVEYIICDDGSTDGTSERLTEDFPGLQLFRHEKSKGLIYSRNRLMERAAGEFAISLDDDLHFLTVNPLEEIDTFFNIHPECAVVSFRIYWNTSAPETIMSNHKTERVKSFAGGAHAWRMSAWKTIPDYPDWFVFYGEEDFAAYQLFKKQKQIYYLPSVPVHHRVDLKERKNKKDYRLRLRRSLRSGWYLYFMFYPWLLIPRRLAYSLWIQLRKRTLKGDGKATVAIFQAMGDVILNIPRLLRNSNRMTRQEFEEFSTLAETKLYWTPEDEK